MNCMHHGKMKMKNGDIPSGGRLRLEEEADTPTLSDDPAHTRVAKKATCINYFAASYFDQAALDILITYHLYLTSLSLNVFSLCLPFYRRTNRDCVDQYRCYPS